jgi:NADH-quinone oxidoreductase subunit N
MASKLAQAGPGLLLLGAGLIVAGVGFKLALVPFHLWTPDVYQGAPLPVTAFIATVSKGAMFALILRFFTQFGLGDFPAVIDGFALLAILSMLLGNLLAFLQDDLKRMLAYSSIAHMGYLLIPFVAVSAAGERAVAFYLAAYVASSLLAFGIMTVLSTAGEERASVDAYRGLFWEHPWLAVGMAVSLFSLAGVPPSVGLVGKFFLAAAGVESALWWPLIALVVGSVIGVFYYARVGIMLFFRAEKEAEDPSSEEPARSLRSEPWGSTVALGVLALMVVTLGIYPQPLLALIAAIIEGVT